MHCHPMLEFSVDEVDSQRGIPALAEILLRCAAGEDLQEEFIGDQRERFAERKKQGSISSSALCMHYWLSLPGMMISAFYCRLLTSPRPSLSKNLVSFIDYALIRNYFVLLGVLFVVAMGYLFLLARLTSVGYELSDAGLAQSALQDETLRLDDKIRYLKSFDRLASIASGLNMREPNSVCIIDPSAKSKNQWFLFRSIATDKSGRTMQGSTSLPTCSTSLLLDPSVPLAVKYSQHGS